MFPHTYLFKSVSAASQQKKRVRGLCVSWGCKRVAEPTKTRCPTCRSRLYRLRNEDRYVYANLRRSAQKRGIGFELSFEDFQEFCSTTEYIERRGKQPGSLSIDRIHNDQPYRLGNIRILDYVMNVSHKAEGLEEIREAVDF